MKIFKKGPYLERSIKVLIFLDVVLLVSSFFSPSLPRLSIPFGDLAGELLITLLLLVLTYGALRGEELLSVLSTDAFRKGALLFVVILLLQILTRIPFLINYLAALDSDKAVTLLMVKNISKGTSFPIYFYGQLYQGSLNAYIYSLFHVLIPSLRLSVLIGNAVFFSGFVLFSSLLINKVTDSTSPFYPVVILSLPLTGLLVGSMDQVRGFPLVACLQLVLMYLVYIFIFEKDEHFFAIGLTTGLLLWSYQGSVSVVAAVLIWIFWSLVSQRRVDSLLRGVSGMSVGFLVGGLPHILSELNNGLVNTRDLFLSQNVLRNLESLSATSLSALAGTIVTSLDSTRILSYTVIFLSACGFLLSLHLAIRNRDVRKLYLPTVAVLGLCLPLVSSFAPIPRYLPHYRFHFFFFFLLAVLALKEMKAFDKRAAKGVFVLMCVVFTLWRSVERYPGARDSHEEEEKTFAAMGMTKEKVVLGDYWSTIRFAPYIDDARVITTSPSFIHPEGILAFAKYYPLALRLGELWEGEEKALIVRRHASKRIDALLEGLDITFSKRRAGKYVLYSEFSRSLSPYVFALLSEYALRREYAPLREYARGVDSPYFYVREKLPSLPGPTVDGGRISLLTPRLERLAERSGRTLSGGWRYVLRKGREQISFPLDFSGKKASYSLPKFAAFRGGKYQKYVYFLDMPVHHDGEIELKEDYEGKSLILSDMRDRVRFVAFGPNQRRRGLPINELELTVLDEAISSLELHVYSFFDFGSSLWTNRYHQMLLVNGEEIPLRHGENRVVYSVAREKEIFLSTKHKTLLCARDSKRNVEFHNTGAALEKVVVRLEDSSYSIVPFLREDK